MSLRHLYKDLQGLRSYPDIIPSKDSFYGMILIKDKMKIRLMDGKMYIVSDYLSGIYVGVDEVEYI